MKTQNYISINFLCCRQGIDSVFRMETPSSIYHISSTKLLFWYSLYLRYVNMKTVDKKWITTVDK